MSPTIDELAARMAPWLQADGDLSDNVISSRIRLARNLARIPYPSIANAKQQAEVMEAVAGVTESTPQLKDGTFLRARDLDTTDRQVLVERHITSPEFMRDNIELGVVVSAGEEVAVSVNEEDHLRIQALGSGLSLRLAWERAAAVDEALDGSLTFDFDREFGYLTACPTNVGTGLRASVLVHLPALVLTREIESYLNRLNKLGFVARGFYGEGTDVQGNLFQVSNQTTLGQAEEEIVGDLENIVKQLVDQEREAEKTLARDALVELEDRVWRAYAIITHARMLNSGEMMNLLSAVRLGAGLKVLPPVPLPTLNELLILTQPAHLQKAGGGQMSTEERDARRAELFRERLAG
jgi:protein arginine kinase